MKAKWQLSVTIWVLVLGSALLGGASIGTAQVAPAPTVAASSNTFTDPLLETGPDPWVVWWKGFYYYSNSSSTNLTLRKTADITDLRHAQKKAVWTPEPGHPWSQQLWAPELHRWGNTWYIYFAADAGDNASHRIYVVQNESDDPMEGTWTLKGKINDPSDRWAIDATTFELHGQHYLVWSGWKGANDGEQDLYIAHMSNPWTIDSPRTLISKPTLPWEEHGNLPGRHVNVNEGPEFLSHGDKMFIVFSASGCWTDFYTLGVLEASASADPLEAKNWTKINHPFSAPTGVPAPSGQATTASSSRLTAGRTGSSITPTPHPAKAAKTSVRHASSGLPGMRRAGRSSANRCRSANRSKSRRSEGCRGLHPVEIGQ